MISRMSHSLLYVLDQEQAKEFYVGKLGFAVGHDVVMGEEFEGAGQGIRWLTVRSPSQPDLELILADCAMGHDPQTAATIRELVAKGAFSGGAMATTDCHGDFKTLSDQGVVFLQEPIERPYGIEAVFRDDSGNWFSLTQPIEPPARSENGPPTKGDRD